MPPTRGTCSILEQTQRHGMPELYFDIQPAKGHRFRYESEFGKGSHGKLKGRMSPAHGQNTGRANTRNICPVVHLINYVGPESVKLQVRFHTPDGRFQHAHKLVEGSCDIPNQPGVVEADPQRLSNGTLEWRLDKISICYSGRKELEACFKQNYLPECNTLTGTKKKDIESSGVLHVSAFTHNNVRVCSPIISDVILNSKEMQIGMMNIDEIDKVAGCATGKDEVIILCTKIPKKLIDSSNLDASQVCIEFFEIDEAGSKVWSQFAKLILIHHQFAIKFNTPAYKDVNIAEEVHVWVQLRSKDEKNCSVPRQFTYWPKEEEFLARKRQKVSELELQPRYFMQQGYTPITPVNSAAESLSHLQLPTGYTTPITPVSSAPKSMGAEPFSYAYLPTGGELMVQSDDSYTNCNTDFGSDLPSTATAANQEVEYMLENNLPLMDENNDPMLGEGSFTFEEEFKMIDFQVDSKTNAATLVKQEEKNGEADQAKTENPVKEQKPPAAAPKTNGMAMGTHPDKYLAIKLALHTAQCLHNFAKTGNVRVLLMSMRHLVALQDEKGDNAIHAAVIHSQSEAMESLIEVARTVAEYDVLNMCNELKESPLHIAVHTGQMKAIKLLLHHGANPNMKDRKGNTPIHLAAQSRNAESLMALLESNAYVTKYKKHAPDLNALNFSGFSALHLAVVNDSLSAVKSLWYSGCDVDVRDRTSGRTALHFAVERHNLEIVSFLLHQADAETDIHMFNGNTPLHLACSQNHADTVAILMSVKADPYLENYERAENSEDDSDSLDSASLEDEDVRGLTSIDLASSEEIRSLLRGEVPLSSMSSESTMSVCEKAAEVEAAVVHHKSDPDKADPGTDSGIGLSGRGFSSNSPNSSSISISQAHKKLTLSDILDAPLQVRLARILDGPPDYNWRKVLVYLDMIPLEETLASHMSPTQGMLHYIQASDIKLFGEILVALDLYSAMDVLQEAKDKWDKRQEEEAYLDSKMRKMKL